MTDRELLELAAKAAGHRIVEWVQDGNGVDVAIIIRADSDGFSKRPWQPLHENQMTDSDGDAFRLAVRLGMRVSLREAHADGGAIRICDDSEDWMCATCRAIVRAAAEIGRSMK